MVWIVRLELTSSCSQNRRVTITLYPDNYLFNGEGDRIRTYDLSVKSRLLYQLSYTSILVWIEGLKPSQSCSQNKWTTIIQYPDIIFLATRERIELSVTDSKSVVLPLHHPALLFFWQELRDSNPRPRFWRPIFYH